MRRYSPLKGIVVFSVTVLLVAFGLPSPTIGQGQEEGRSLAEGNLPEISYEKFTLDNGLTVVVSEDDSVPLVNVRMWYDAGMRHGPYAHLYEHVMLNGSEHAPGSWYDTLSELGVGPVDATTLLDRTNYFETIPRSALDPVLWLESDRMANPQITKGNLKKEIKIVRNENRMRRSRPGRQIQEATLAAAYPESHPYRQALEAPETVENANLEDLKDWHQRYYGAANATLVLSGDVDPDSVRDKVEQYFGALRSGPTLDRDRRWIAKRSEQRHRRIHADVSEPRLRLAWNVPGWGEEGSDYLLLAKRMLGGSDGRLARRLETKDDLVSSVEVALDRYELGGQFIVDVVAQSVDDLRQVETLVQREIGRLAQEGPSDDALRRARAQHELDFSKKIQRLGRWWEGTSNVLARGEAYRGDPGHYKTTLRRIRAASPADVQVAVQRWLREGGVVLDVLPTPQHAPTADSMDRAERPAAGSLPEVTFPEVQQQTLASGVDLVSVPRENANLTHLDLVVESGSLHDLDGAAGTSALVLRLVKNQDSLTERLQDLGVEVKTHVGLLTSRIRLTARPSALEPAVQTLWEAAFDPSFTAEEVDRAVAQQQSAIRQELEDPLQLVWRFLPKLLYGDGHPYGRPFPGTGTSELLENLSVEDVRQFHRDHYQGSNATLIVTGDVSSERVGTLLKQTAVSAGEGTASSSPPEYHSPRSSEPTVHLVNQEGADRSVLFAAQTVPEKAKEPPAAYEALRYALGGGTPQSRLMKTLREDKGWAYRAAILQGKSVQADALKEGEPLVVYAPVQTNKTAAAMQEIVRELRAVQRKRPVTQKELDRIQTARTMEMAGNLQTLEAMSDLLHTQIASDRPLEEPLHRLRELRTLSPETVTSVAQEALRPNELTWLVVGDISEIEEDIRQAGLGEVRVLTPSESAPAEE